MLTRLLLDPDPTDGGGGGNPPPKADPPAAPDFDKLIAEAIKKHGDPNAALRVLLTEHSAKDARIAELTGKLPKDGHHVIDPDTHKLFGSYQALGKPDEVQAKLDRLAEVETKLTGIERAQHFADVARASSYDPDVLTTLAEKDGKEIALEEKDGKDRFGKPVKVQVASVKTKDAKGADVLTPLKDYAEKNWAKFLPALKAETAPAVPPRGSPTVPAGNPRPPIKETDQPRRSLVR